MHQKYASLFYYIIEKCPSFRAKDCNAEFSQIFQESVFNFQNDFERAMFLSTYQFNQLCTNCDHQCVGSVDVFLQYFSWEGDVNDVIVQWPELLFSENLFVNKIICQLCQTTLRTAANL